MCQLDRKNLLQTDSEAADISLEPGRPSLSLNEAGLEVITLDSAQRYLCIPQVSADLVMPVFSM